MTQNNLGTTLSELAGRKEGQVKQDLLDQAVRAFKLALDIRTRSALPQQWATTQHNLGAALIEQGIRTGGAEGQQLLRQAVAAYRAALEVRTKESLAPQWAQTHNNLAEASMALGDWEQVVTSYRNVLELYPEYQDAYLNMNAVLHEQLFRFAEAFALNEQWIQAHPEDEAAKMNFAEAHLTTGHFDEAEQRFAKLLSGTDLDAQATIPLSLLNVISLIAQNKRDVASEQLKKISVSLRTQPEDFSLSWSFEGTKHFIGQDEAFASSREWLLKLLDEFSGKMRNDMLEEVEAAQARFAAVNSPSGASIQQ